MRAVAAGVAAVALVAVPAARGDDATRAEVRDLARRATGDERALEELRRIDRVDGMPVELRTALASDDGEALEQRLAALAGGSRNGAVAPASAEARAEAAEILSERRFDETGPPRPFRRFLDWLGERLRPLGRPFEWLAGWIPGGASALWTALGVAVIAAAAAFAAWLGRRRGGTVVDSAARAGDGHGLDPRRLERLAEEAEARGELELALRLRFRAGLTRLARQRSVPSPETLTSRQLVRLLGSEHFGRLARDLDEVVYGGRPATAADVEAARTGWPAVLAGAGRS